MNAVYREFFADEPPVRTTVVADLADGAAVAISAVAVPDGAPREVLQPAGWVKSPRPYSYVVRAGDLVYFSGLISRRGTDDQAVLGSTQLQMKTILDNAGVLLQTAGLDYSDVVAARVYLTDDSFFEEMNDEYRRVFPDRSAGARDRHHGADGRRAPWRSRSWPRPSTSEILGPTVSPTLPVSTAVRVGPRVFLSGVLGNTDTNIGDVGSADATRRSPASGTRSHSPASRSPTSSTTRSI